MKNRKHVVVAFLLVAAMMLGIGYAALTDTLNIEGDAEVSHAGAQEAMDKEVYFSAVSQGAGYTAEILSTNNDKANFTVTGLDAQDETITITFTIKNENDFPVYVNLSTTPVTNTQPAVFALGYPVNEFEIAAAGTYDVPVSVTMINIPHLEEDAVLSATFGIEYTVSNVSAAAPAPTPAA